MTSQRFEGLDLIESQEDRIAAQVIVENEIPNPDVAYEISHAGRGNPGDTNSGYSFGANQMDLGQGRGRDVFEDIIRSQISDEFMNNIEDRVYARGNPEALSHVEIREINAVLSSEYGRSRINQEFVNEFYRNAEDVGQLERNLGVEFSTDVRISIIDFSNQYGLSGSLNDSDNPSTLAYYLREGFVNNGLDIVLQDVESYIRGTREYRDSSRSQENRIQRTRSILEQNNLIEDDSTAESSLQNSLNTRVDQASTQEEKQQAVESWFDTFSDSLSDWTDSVSGFLEDVASDISSVVSDASSAVIGWFSGGISELNATEIDPSQINNSLLDLTINTDLTQDFRPSSNPTQTGNAIDGGDYFIESDINVLNGDGVENTTSMGILTDQYRPGNTMLSPNEDFMNSLTINIGNLESMQQESSRNQNNNQLEVPHFELQNPMANLTNQSIDAQTFINIDPVILDLNNNNAIFANDNYKIINNFRGCSRIVFGQ